VLEPICTDTAPAYPELLSQAVRIAGLVYCSGQVAISVEAGGLVGVGDAAIQARQVFANLENVLRAAGTSLSNSVKVTIYLTSMTDYAAINSVFKSVFPGTKPARTCVAVAALPHPDATVEIELIATAAGNA
jgi:2-iminobutanoate/2-iminopropanoate deaminase